MEFSERLNTPETLHTLLQASGRERDALHEDAATLRDSHFGKNVFVRAVVEISNFCRENCQYCGMRRDNRDLERYRLSEDALLEMLLENVPPSVTDLNIQAGEDPVAVRKIAIPLIRALKKYTSLGISACLGTLSDRDYEELKDAGADFYIIKLETGNAAHFCRLEAPGNVEERIGAIRRLVAGGWHVSSGFIYGLPDQDAPIIAETLSILRALPLAGWSVSPFIPGTSTPLANHAAASLDETLNCLAFMRMLAPARIIPAVSAMTLVGEDGYTRALRAGANLATINLTPTDQRGKYVIYDKNRSIMTEERILRAIEAAGCTPSTVGMTTYLRTAQYAA
jgi:biotin synthase